MRKTYLRIVVFFLHVLITLNLRPNVWYQCELDLAKIKAKEWCCFFDECNKDF